MLYSRESIGKIIYLLRTFQSKAKRPNMRQADISKALGISQGTLSKIENGLLEPGTSELFVLLKCLHVTPDEFYYFLEAYQHLDRATFEQLVRVHISMGADKFKQIIGPYLDNPTELAKKVNGQITATLAEQNVTSHTTLHLKQQGA